MGWGCRWFERDLPENAALSASMFYPCLHVAGSELSCRGKSNQQLPKWSKSSHVYILGNDVSNMSSEHLKR
jgi:hypothetical protein